MYLLEKGVSVVHLNSSKELLTRKVGHCHMTLDKIDLSFRTIAKLADFSWYKIPKGGKMYQMTK
jgi:hypothetical protein